MPDQKKVTVVLNTEGTAVDATKSVVEASGLADSVKQRIPFLRAKNTAIVEESTVNAIVGDGAILAIGAVIENKLNVVGRAKAMVA